MNSEYSYKVKSRFILLLLIMTDKYSQVAHQIVKLSFGTFKHKV